MSTVEFTSEVARGIRFRERMRGYSPDEVDAFQERAAYEIEQLRSRLEDASERAARAEAAARQETDGDERAMRTLVLAQRTAEAAIAEARADADELRRSAETETAALLTEARSTLDRARTESTELLEAANLEANARLSGCEAAIAAAEAEAEARIAEMRGRSDAELAERSRDVETELAATLASLGTQRDELEVHVEFLREYIAVQRRHVLDVLGAMIDSVQEGFEPPPPPDLDLPIHRERAQRTEGPHARRRGTGFSDLDELVGSWTGDDPWSAPDHGEVLREGPPEDEPEHWGSAVAASGPAWRGWAELTPTEPPDAPAMASDGSAPAVGASEDGDAGGAALGAGALGGPSASAGDASGVGGPGPDIAARAALLFTFDNGGVADPDTAPPASSSAGSVDLDSERRRRRPIPSRRKS